MTDVWKNIFKKYIADFHAIDKLQADNIIEDEDTYKLKNKLLVDIICTFESEVNEQLQIHGSILIKNNPFFSVGALINGEVINSNTQYKLKSKEKKI